MDENNNPLSGATASRDIYRECFEIAEVILLALNAAAEVVDINRKGCELLGYPKEEIVGRNWFETFLPETMRDEVKTVFATIISGRNEAVASFQNPVVTRAGHLRMLL